MAKKPKFGIIDGGKKDDLPSKKKYKKSDHDIYHETECDRQVGAFLQANAHKMLKPEEAYRLIQEELENEQNKVEQLRHKRLLEIK